WNTPPASAPRPHARSTIISTNRRRARSRRPTISFESSHGCARCRAVASAIPRSIPQAVDAAARGVFGAVMTTTTNPQASARAFALPNMLTYGRIVAVPLVVACMYAQSVLGYGLWLRWVALAIFIVAGITDVLDGYAARTYGQQSSFGRMLDPIADKLLVSSCLLMLAVDGTIKGLALWAAIIILCREILVSGLREYLAELRVSVPVTALAKWKTFLQLLAVGFCIAGEAGDKI